jgi:hypothetical protein
MSFTTIYFMFIENLIDKETIKDSKNELTHGIKKDLDKLLGEVLGTSWIGLALHKLARKVLGIQKEENKEKINKNQEYYVQKVLERILARESGWNFDAVNPYDVNWVSLSLLQRHGTKAKEFMKDLKEKNEEKFWEIMWSEFNNLDDTWLRTTKRNEDKIERFKKLMSDEEFQEVAKEKAQEDVKGYLVKIMNKWWVQDHSAILYLGSIYNAGSWRAKRVYEAAKEKEWKLVENLYQATKEVSPSYYEKAKNALDKDYEFATTT